MNIAERIRTLRKRCGISQEELADRIGVSRQAVSKWESAQSTPDIEKLLLLSEFFGVSTDYLLKGASPAKESPETTTLTATEKRTAAEEPTATDKYTAAENLRKQDVDQKQKLAENRTPTGNRTDGQFPGLDTVLTILKKVLCALCLALLTLAFLLPSLLLIPLSMREYRPVYGLFRSPYVGFANIAEFLTSPQLTRILVNNFTISIAALLLGAVYVLLSTLAIRSFRSHYIRAALAILFVLPAILPANSCNLLLQKLLPSDFFIRSSPALQFTASLETGLRFSAPFVIGALFSGNNRRQTALKYTLLFLALRLLSLLRLDTGFLSDFYNPLTYEHLDTFGTYVFRMGLMQSNFSGYAAGYVVQLLLQFLPALLGGTMFILLWKKNDRTSGPTRIDHDTTMECHSLHDARLAARMPMTFLKKQFLPSLIGILPLALLLLSLITSTGNTLGLDQPLIIQAYANGIAAAAVSSGIVVFLGIILAWLAGRLNAIGVCMLSTLCFLSDNLLGFYMMGRNLGVTDSLAGIVFQNLYVAAPAALLFLFAMRELQGSHRPSAMIPAALGIAFAWFWGDHTAALITLRSTHRFPISLFVHNLLNQTDATAISSEAAQLTTTPYLLLPLLVAGMGILITANILQQQTNRN